MKHEVYNGKIGRLPESLREELCRRIRDGKTGREILPWLNELPEVKAALAERWKGKPVSDANLTEWRQRGYQDWLNNQREVSLVRADSEMAAALAKAANGSLAEGASAIGGGNLFGLMRQADKAKRVAEEAFSIDPSADNRAVLDAAVSRVLELLDYVNELRSGDNESKKVAIAGQKVALEEIRVMGDAAERVQKILRDDRLRNEINSTGDNRAQLELIGRELFGERWKGIKAAA